MTLIQRFGAAAAAAFLMSTAAAPAVLAQSGPPSSQSDRDRPGSSQDRGGDQNRDQDRDRDRDRDRGESDRNSDRYRIVSTVNLRSGPGTNHRRIGQLRAGRVVEVDQRRNGWLHVRGQGWISGQYARRA